MQKRSIVVFTFDALSLAAFGPYGCSWLETPGMDQLAARSVIYDRAFACSTDPRIVLSRCLATESGEMSVPKLARSLGMPTLFFTDSAEAADLSVVNDFDQCILVESPDSVSLADDFEETAMARLLAAAFDRRESLAETPHVLWIHAACLSQRWDAPVDFRESDDIDPDLLQESNNEEGADLRSAFYASLPPSVRIDKEDPDLLLAHMAAYGAQVRVIDSLMEVAMDAFSAEQDTAVIVASTGGISLGHDGWIGTDAGSPKSARLHVPLIMRIPACEPIRCGKPVLTDRLCATLIDLLKTDSETGSLKMTEGSLLEEAEPERWAEYQDDQHPILSITDERGQQAGSPSQYRLSPGWFYIQDGVGNEQLYLKPDDRHDVNNIATLRPEVLEIFRETCADA
jgi:hypothetical protein